MVLLAVTFNVLPPGRRKMTPPPVFGRCTWLQLTDAFARKFYYLRLSITDVVAAFVAPLPAGWLQTGSVTNSGFTYRR